jgi:hypothetical protein
MPNGLRTKCLNTGYRLQKCTKCVFCVVCVIYWNFLSTYVNCLECCHCCTSLCHSLFCPLHVTYVGLSASHLVATCFCLFMCFMCTTTTTTRMVLYTCVLLLCVLDHILHWSVWFHLISALSRVYRSCKGLVAMFTGRLEILQYIYYVYFLLHSYLIPFSRFL